MNTDQQEVVSYSSTQHTCCAGCGQDKHTPLRRDDMGGYVCLICIDKWLDKVRDEKIDKSKGDAKLLTVTPRLLTIVPPFSDLLLLLRLYLERYEALVEEDRRLCRQALLLIINPALVVTKEYGPEEPHWKGVEHVEFRV